MVVGPIAMVTLYTVTMIPPRCVDTNTVAMATRYSNCTFIYVCKKNVSFNHYFQEIHSVQRLITSKGAKRRIWDDITVILKYFRQITIVRNEDLNKDDTSILIFSHSIKFSTHFGTVLTEEIWTAKFCTEVFEMPKHIKVNIPESFSYMSPLRTIVLFQPYCRITLMW